MEKIYVSILVVCTITYLVIHRMRMKPKDSVGWPPEAQKFLYDLYEKYGSRTYEQKYNLLELLLGYSYEFGDDTTFEQELPLLEQEYLINNGVIRPVLA
jgi:hypothetical protein